MNVDLAPLLPHLPAWLMVLFRLTGIFILAPMLGSGTVFRQLKVFLVLGLSFCIYPMLLAPGRPAAGAMIGFMDGEIHLWLLAVAVGLELLIGFIIGFCASLPLIGMQVGGHVIDQQIGLGLAGVFNPELNEQSGVVGEFFFVLALTIFAILGGHNVLFLVLAGSFDHVPPGGLTHFGSILDLVVGLLSASFEFALRIAAPVLCLIFLETVAMGFVARTVPQINILSIGFAVRILLGAGMLIGFVSVVANVYVDNLQWTMRQLLNFFAL